MDKFEYIRKQFSKANRKSYELYITTRLWNKLDRLDVEFITQQPVTTNGKLYYTDIYFPQIKFHIEIDEEYHEKDSQREQDAIRQKDIISATSHEIWRIKATEDLETINKKIDEIVDKINFEIKELGNNFKPWTLEIKSSDFYTNQGYMDSKENVAFNTIHEACNCFGHNYKGFQRGETKHPIKEGYFIWFPKFYKNKDWDNTISEDESMIFEKSVENNTPKRIEKAIKAGHETRLVFARVKGPLGDIMYRFKGLYRLDKEESRKRNCCVFNKIDDRVKTYKHTI